MTAPASGPGQPFVSQAQRQAADPAASVWVAASAGSGKTKALTDRVLRLLLDGTAPERLLCLTFTRAAAAEMANRVNRALGAWTMQPDDELDAALAVLTGTLPDPGLRERARRLFASVLDAPGGLKIMTIHAFCQSLLGRFPLEAGVAPHFELIDERSAAELLDDAQATVLAQARDGADESLAAALDTVALHAGEESFADLMNKLRALRIRLRRLLRGHEAQGLDGVIAATRRLLGADPETTPESIVATACAEGAFNRAALGAAGDVLAGGSAAEQKRGARIAGWLAAPEHERVAGFDDYKGVFLTAKDEPRSERGLLSKNLRETEPEAFAALRAEQDGLVDTIERRNVAITAAATTALLRLGDAMLGEYDRRKQARARLDYDDLILTAARLLEGEAGEAAWVLYKLDGGIDHILVDEAQDTSPEQWRVIAALATEFFTGEGARETLRTVFVVGDEKQSIFSFQGADRRELERMRTAFRARVEAAQQDWNEVDLGRSFRSTAAVLRAVDTVFASPAASAGVAFADHAISHESHRAGHAGRVELWPLVRPAEAAPRVPWLPPTSRLASDSPRTRLARHIAVTIEGWIAGGERLEARGRAIRPGDILVLVRTRSAFVEELVRALKGLGVAVAGADRMVLSDQIAVMDLVVLGQFLLLPEDDLALATVLKGPLVGLSEDQLFDLAHGRGDAGLWRTLVRRRGEDPAYGEAHEGLAGLLARADFTPPYELFADLLAAGGGRRKLVARLGPDANDPLDEFLAQALAYERTGPPSLQGFLHWFAAGEVQIKRDLDRGRDEVRVMTVHGAKGLEAPIVILPDTTSLPQGRGVQLLWHQGDDAKDDPRDETGALLWPGRASFAERRCREAKAAAAERDMQEYRRLLYVALTRAEDRLYIAGWQGRKAIPEACWYRLIESALVGAASAEPFAFDAWEGDGRAIAEPQTREPEAQPAATRAPREADSLPGFARAPAPPEPTPPRPLAPSRAPAELALGEPAVFSPLAVGAEDTRFLRGRVIHRLLQVLPEVAPGDRPAVAARMTAGDAPGLDGAARDAMAAEVLAILGDEHFAALFGPDSRAEAPLIGTIGEAVIAGQVDRLVVGANEVMVIDYKTNRPAPADEAGVAPAYVAQMAAYRAVLAQIYPDKTISCALLWTDGPRLMRLGDEALDRHAP